ncbi:MAG: AsmA family protein [Deltaproteobacteria bacterium]|nr:AsmA family protein [Candidatus Zymogenaceae bacterium]
MTRRTIITLCIVSCTVLMAAASLIFLPKLIDTSDYRHSVALWLSERLGRPATIGDLSLSVITGPKIILKDLSIADDPDFSNEPFLTARQVDVSVRLIPLLSGNVVVSGIVVKEPEFSIIEKDDAQLNLASLSFGGSTSRSIDILKASLFHLDMGRFTSRTTLPDEIDVKNADITYTIIPTDGQPDEIIRIKDMDIWINHIEAVRSTDGGRSMKPAIPLSGDVSISISTGLIKGLPFDDLRLTGKIRNDTLRIDKMNTSVFGGVLEVSGYVNVATLKKELVVNARLSNVMANKLFSIIRKDENTCFGVLNFEGTFTATGKTTGEMIGNLSGEGLIRIEDGHIPSFNIRTELSSLGLISNGGITTILDTSFSIIGGSFVLSGNKFVTSKLAIKSEEWDAVVRGEIDLTGIVDFYGDIFLSHTMALDIKPEYITSLMHNPSGRLSLPISVTGNVESLEFLLRPEFLTEKDADEIFEEFKREISERYKEGYSIKFINRISF